MYVATIPNRGSPPAILLRESYREAGKTKNRTLANLSDWPSERIELFRALLRGDKLARVGNNGFEIRRSLPHGHVLAALTVARRIGLDDLLPRRAPQRRRDLALALIVARLLDPAAKLATARMLDRATASHSLGETLGLGGVAVREIYATLDWLGSEQAFIENTLARRHLKNGMLVLYDVTPPTSRDAAVRWHATATDTMGLDSGPPSGSVGSLNPPHWRQTVRAADPRPEVQAAVHTNLGAIFVSLELSRSTWLVTSLSPGGGETMSKYSVRGGDVAKLLERFSALQDKAEKRTSRRVPIVVIQEAGLDGFWIHRTLEGEGIESHVVDAASIATSRRRRRAKTDRIDGEALVRTLLAYKRGEPRVCAMVRVPTPEEEDRRRISRERKTLTAERVAHVNRIKGLLFTHGIEYEPAHRNRRARLEELRTRDGGPLPTHLKRQISRELDRLELILEQIKAVEAERNALLAPTTPAEVPTPAKMLMDLKGIGAEFAMVLWTEGLFRQFDNRRQVAAYAGLAPTPWQSGTIDREQGVGKSGNPRLRTTMLQLAWLWLRHQPDSALSRWFHERVERNGGRFRKTMITALARKLLVALWKYATAGVVIEGATIRTASR